MSRAISYAKPTGTRGLGERPADDYYDRLVKLIPAEVIGVYLSMIAVAKSDDDIPLFVPWLVFFFGFVATYYYSKIVLEIKETRQLAVMVGAFCVWALSLGFPFEDVPGYSASYGAMILPAYTFVVPMIIGEQKKS